MWPGTIACEQPFGQIQGNPRAPISCPTGLKLDRHVVRVGVTDAADRVEPPALPLAYGVEPVEQLIAQVELAQQGLVGMALDVGGDGFAIHRAYAFDRLRQQLVIRVVQRAAIEVGIDAGNLLVQLVEGAGVRVVRDAAPAENVLRRGTEFPVVTREGAAIPLKYTFTLKSSILACRSSRMCPADRTRR